VAFRRIVMEIETFEVSEDADTGKTVRETDDAALALIDSLGLKGQQKLVMARDDGVKARIPYREMTAQEFAVYSEVFSSHTRIADYEAGPIPLRVLQVAAHAKEFFPHIQVWHRAVADKDPLLVGRQGEYDRKIFLLARWGDALVSFQSLVTEARRVLRMKWEERMADVESSLSDFRKNIESRLDQRVELGKDVSLYF
jgi:hypothetical protein